MSAISTLQEQNIKKLQELFEVVGGYSFKKHLLIAAGVALLLVLGPSLIGALRGNNRSITRAAQRDVLIGIACLLPIITFFGFFFFVARGYWIALRADSR